MNNTSTQLIPGHLYSLKKCKLSFTGYAKQATCTQLKTQDVIMFLKTEPELRFSFARYFMLHKNKIVRFALKNESTLNDIFQTL